MPSLNKHRLNVVCLNRVDMNTVRMDDSFGSGTKPWEKYVKEGLIFQLDSSAKKYLSVNIGETDDAATANMGAEWRTPSPEEWQELIDNCTWTWEEHDGIKGTRVTATNGNNIFIPGSFDDRDKGSYNSIGCYWTNTLKDKNEVLCLLFQLAYVQNVTLSFYRNIGKCVRAVSDTEGVDMGLPSGTKWADHNVGASTPEEIGDYFAWAETETKTTFTFDNYKYANESIGWTKYNDVDGLRSFVATSSTTWTDIIGGLECRAESELNINKGVSFDGTTYLTMPNIDAQNVTIEVCCKFDEEPNDVFLMSASPNLLCAYVNNGYLSGNKWGMKMDPSVDKTTTLTVYNDEQMYQDGVLLTQQGSGYSKFTYDVLGYNLKGKIFAVRIYNRQLTTDELSSNAAIDRKRFKKSYPIPDGALVDADGYLLTDADGYILVEQ